MIRAVSVYTLTVILLNFMYFHIRYLINKSFWNSGVWIKREKGERKTERETETKRDRHRFRNRNCINILSL